MDFDFKELASDETLVKNMTDFAKAVEQIEQTFKYADEPGFYDKLSRDQKIQFDLLMSFSLNSLFWMNLKLAGFNFFSDSMHVHLNLNCKHN